MKRIAIIADIHANLPALEAVIADLQPLNPDEILVAGDLVGRGPQGTAVVRRIASQRWRSVRGNHEDYLLSFVRGDIPDAWRHAEEWAASRWMADELDEESVRFIDALPFSIQSSIDPDIEVFHGSPNSHSEGIGGWTPEDRLETFLEAIDGTVLVCAHTHRPLCYRSEAGLIVNAGSVGLPFNGDPRAQYVMLHGQPGQWEVEFRQVDYDRQALLAHYNSSGFLTKGAITAELLRREVEAARPFLVPFLNWAEISHCDPTTANLEAFLSVYDPHQSMAEFFASLRGGSSK